MYEKRDHHFICLVQWKRSIKVSDHHSYNEFDLYVHLKNTSKTFQALKGIYVQKATKYQKEVTFKKHFVPFCQS